MKGKQNIFVWGISVTAALLINKVNWIYLYSQISTTNNNEKCTPRTQSTVDSCAGPSKQQL